MLIWGRLAYDDDVDHAFFQGRLCDDWRGSFIVSAPGRDRCEACRVRVDEVRAELARRLVVEEARWARMLAY